MMLNYNSLIFGVSPIQDGYQNQLILNTKIATTSIDSSWKSCPSLIPIINRLSNIAWEFDQNGFNIGLFNISWYLCKTSWMWWETCILSVSVCFCRWALNIIFGLISLVYSYKRNYDLFIYWYWNCIYTFDTSLFSQL